MLQCFADRIGTDRIAFGQIPDLEALEGVQCAAQNVIANARVNIQPGVGAVVVGRQGCGIVLALFNHGRCLFRSRIGGKRPSFWLPNWECMH